MTEQEWFGVPHTAGMLDIVKESSGRKLRLYACACCCRVWEKIGRPLPNEVRVAEGFADGVVSEAVFAESGSRLGARGGYSAAWAANCLLHGVLDPDAFEAATRATTSLIHFFHFFTVERLELDDPNAREEGTKAASTEDSRLPLLVRDIFGNPFQPVKFNKKWRTLDVMLLAQGIYDERAFDRMPILADALQDAGCDNEDILNHCRDPKQVHARGCWVVDLVLEKQ